MISQDHECRIRKLEESDIRQQIQLANIEKSQAEIKVMINESSKEQQKTLNDLEIKIDFTFKNGKWNYMQAVPKIAKENKNLEWFSKIELMLQNEDIRELKIHLLYKESDFIEDKATHNLLRYLKNSHKNIDIHNVDKQNEVTSLCEYIQSEGQVLIENVG